MQCLDGPIPPSSNNKSGKCIYTGVDFISYLGIVVTSALLLNWSLNYQGTGSEVVLK